MVTIVLLVIWVGGTVPKHEDRIINICVRITAKFAVCVPLVKHCNVL